MIFKNLVKSNCSELLTILLRQHLSADDLRPLLLRRHLSADDLGNPRESHSLKSLRNHLKNPRKTYPERCPCSGRGYWVTACCDPRELTGSHLGSLFVGWRDD